jgi:hypothetical protein
MTGPQNANPKSDVNDISRIFDHYRTSARAIWNTAFWPDQDFRNWDSIDQFHQIEKPLFQELVKENGHCKMFSRMPFPSCTSFRWV